MTPLSLAAKGGAIPMITLLLENGANVNCRNQVRHFDFTFLILVRKITHPFIAQLWLDKQKL
jgi:ankyrin repeat protein